MTDRTEVRDRRVMTMGRWRRRKAKGIILVVVTTTTTAYATGQMVTARYTMGSEGRQIYV